MTNKLQEPEEKLVPRWYVLHSYSGHENRVKSNLEQRVINMDMEDRILEVFVPEEEEVEIQSGQRKTVLHRVFPGYVFVRMLMGTEDTEWDEKSLLAWRVVRETPGVTGFISSEDDRGERQHPVPLDTHEEQTILGFKTADRPRTYVGFTKGQSVRITDGPFSEFMGVVDEVYSDRQKLRVLMSFFGRETPVELDFLHVERI